PSKIRFVGTAVAPANTAVPTVTGPTTPGSVLTAGAGGWSGTGPVMAYQWSRCNSAGASCVDVGGATAKTYTLLQGDVGFTFRIQVTASNAAGSASASSAATTVVTAPPAPPSNTSPPTISG